MHSVANAMSSGCFLRTWYLWGRLQLCSEYWIPTPRDLTIPSPIYRNRSFTSRISSPPELAFPIRYKSIWKASCACPVIWIPTASSPVRRPSFCVTSCVPLLWWLFPLASVSWPVLSFSKFLYYVPPIILCLWLYSLSHHTQIPLTCYQFFCHSLIDVIYNLRLWLCCVNKRCSHYSSSQVFFWNPVYTQPNGWSSANNLWRRGSAISKLCSSDSHHRGLCAARYVFIYKYWSKTSTC